MGCTACACSTCSLLCSYYCGVRDSRCLMIGLDASGKTTILYHLKLGSRLYVPAIGFNVETIQHNNLSLTIWDVGGQAKIRPLWKHYYANTDAIIFVIDSTNKERLDGLCIDYKKSVVLVTGYIGNIQKLLELSSSTILNIIPPSLCAVCHEYYYDPTAHDSTAKVELHKALRNKELEECIFLIWANMSDLSSAMSVKELTQRLELHQNNLTKNRKWHIQKCCALTGDGIYEGLDWLTKNLK